MKEKKVRQRPTFLRRRSLFCTMYRNTPPPQEEEKSMGIRRGMKKIGHFELRWLSHF
jgi:hypothetical protein